MATIKAIGESPCSSGVNIQSSSFRIDLLLHSDELFGVLDQGQSPVTSRRQVDLAAFVGEAEGVDGWNDVHGVFFKRNWCWLV